MLTHTELRDLYRALKDRRVLTAFIDGSTSDPAGQRSWRIRLGHSLAAIQDRVANASINEQQELARDAMALEKRVSQLPDGIGAPGWVAFVVDGEVYDAHPLPVAMETGAVWDHGPCIAPYLHALRFQRPTIVVIADARQAELLRCQLGVVERLEKIHSHHVIEHAEHMGAPPTSGFHTGTRGSTGRDAAARALRMGRERMIDDVAHRALELAGNEAWIVVGGIKRVADQLVDAITPSAPDRVMRSSLDVHAGDAEIAAGVREAMEALQDAADGRDLDAVLESGGAGGLGIAGPDALHRALGASAVRDVYVTHEYVVKHPVDAEESVRAALDQGAEVEEVEGAAGDRLNIAGGVAGRLRFNAPMTR